VSVAPLRFAPGEAHWVGVSKLCARPDVSNCGSLGHVCPSGSNGNRVCVNGTCDYACLPGYDDCDGLLTNGCEAALTTTTHCGRCGTNCLPPANGTAICGYNGAFRRCDVSCNQGYARCGTTACVSLSSDVNNCGICGRRCATGELCTGGFCTGTGMRTCVGIPVGQTFTTACTGGECCWLSEIGGAHRDCEQDQSGHWYCGTLSSP
jgi:hypothetical protein